ncbi:trypsin-like serine protease [Bacillus toyonensis]|uniref:trypsin-like serine peptidase n=1 Tax=Bacillus toyonensis TaxID=155322 RepID=UPI0034673DA1
MKEMSLEDLYNTPPIPATQEIPTEIQDLLKPSSGVYVRSQYEPKLDFAIENVPGVPEMWQVSSCSHDEELLTTIPGEEQIELKTKDILEEKEDVSRTEGYRPPWQPLEYLPRLVPFRVGEQVFLEPRATEEGRRLSFPFNTIGLVKVNGTPAGTGVLVGPNLILTAGHVAPWGAKNWSMEFIPAFRQGDVKPPFGSSFVQRFRGYNTKGEASGHDYVICKLFKPLGKALGFLGTQSFGSEKEYYKRRYVSTGYPDKFNNRPAVEFDMGLRDIDNDSPGIELEFSHSGHPDIRQGWSGGPLWIPGPGATSTVFGICSGSEKDEFDPRFIVFAGGKGMVDLVKFGLANWGV